MIGLFDDVCRESTFATFICYMHNLFRLSNEAENKIMYLLK